MALRCNLVTVLDGCMRSYTVGHIPSAESHMLIASLQEALGRRARPFTPAWVFGTL